MYFVNIRILKINWRKSRINSRENLSTTLWIFYFLLAFPIKLSTIIYRLWFLNWAFYDQFIINTCNFILQPNYQYKSLKVSIEGKKSIKQDVNGRNVFELRIVPCSKESCNNVQFKAALPRQKVLFWSLQNTQPQKVSSKIAIRFKTATKNPSARITAAEYQFSNLCRCR